MNNLVDQSEIEALLKGVSKGKISPDKMPATEVGSSEVTAEPGFPGAFQSLCKDLKSAGVIPALANNLIKMCLRYLKKKGENPEGLAAASALLARAIMSTIKITGPIVLEKGKPKKIAFVGPTGVGKTTTMLKIARRYSLKGKKVALITLGASNIIAAEQLKIHADLFKIPLGIAAVPEELQEKLALFHDRDIILIDTPGQSQNNPRRLDFLKEFFQKEDNEIDLHLVMSATTKDGDLDDIIDKFCILPVNNLLFTKLDESSNYGSILNVAVKYSMPYSYFTSGQNIPEDIERATAKKIANIVLR